jgi:hypothetical protein
MGWLRNDAQSPSAVARSRRMASACPALSQSAGVSSAVLSSRRGGRCSGQLLVLPRLGAAGVDGGDQSRGEHRRQVRDTQGVPGDPVRPAGTVWAHPGGELAAEVGIGELRPVAIGDEVGDAIESNLVLLAGDHTQGGSVTPGLCRELRQDRPWDAARPEAGAVRVSLVDGLEELMVARLRCAGRPELDGGQQVMVSRIREGIDFAGMPEVPDGNEQVAQGRPAADHQRPARRVDHRQPPAAVGVQLESAVVDLEPPGLGVVT